MSFAAPYWLFGLLPWVLVTLYLLWGRRKRVNVPFLELWKGDIEPPRAQRALQPPPLALAAAIFAMLLAILAAARPAVHAPRVASGPPISIIVDRGIGMSDAGYRQLLENAAPAIRQALGPGPVDLMSVPLGAVVHSDRSDWPALAAQFPPTALETRSALQIAIHDRLANASGPVIILTHHAPPVQIERTVYIAPSTMPSNVGIVRFSAMTSPSAQVMVRLRNQSSRSRAVLLITSDQREVHRSNIDLPPVGGERNYFIDVPSLGRVVRAELLADDDLPADNSAALARERAWPILEPRAPLPIELRRMIERYSRLRPFGEQSNRIAIVTSADSLAGDQRAIIVTGTSSPATTRPSASPIIAQHPVTESLQDWQPLAGPASTAPPSDGWTPLISIDGRAVVAARPSPARQLWVDLPLEPWSTTPQFVIFWTNAFNWVGEGGEAFASYPIGQLPDGWRRIDAPEPVQSAPGLWPGIYQRSDGALRAVNALDVRLNPPAPNDWRAQLTALAARHVPGRRNYPMTGILLCIALLAMVLSALTWRRDLHSRPVSAMQP